LWRIARRKSVPSGGVWKIIMLGEANPLPLSGGVVDGSWQGFEVMYFVVGVGVKFFTATTVTPVTTFGGDSVFFNVKKHVFPG
jgi:hypothetical protein